MDNITTPRSKKTIIPLIIEPHPRDYNGLPFITLIQYLKLPMLVVVDNMNEDSIKAYVLDLCGPEGINEELVLSAVSVWYETNRHKYPLSIEFSRLGLVNQTSKIYRSLNVEFVSRIIGPIFKYPMGEIRSIKRRRRKPIPEGIEIVSDNNISQEEWI